MLKLIVCFLIAIVPLGFAHSGYDLVFQDVSIGEYELSLFKDVHVGDGDENRGGLELSLFSKLSQDDQAPQQDIKLNLQLDALEIQNTMRPIGIASDDGKTLYQAYLLTIPISNPETFDALITLETETESHSQAFKINAEPKAKFNPLELLPNLLLILIPLIGFALLFLAPKLSITRKDVQNESQTHFSHT